MTTIYNSGRGSADLDFEIREIHPQDSEWPAGLSDMPEPPEQLYIIGQGSLSAVLGNKGQHGVAIVGSRASTAYGNHVASDLAYGLGGDQYTIVSGGAFGIDQAAHRGAMAAEATTVAVLPGGINRAYPAAHAELFRRIAADGFLVSEYAPGAAPHRTRFLRRNEIIAALCRTVVVVEAARRSGSLNTAEHTLALGHGRKLCAVPGPVTSAMSDGTNRLIANGAAQLVTCVEDIERIARS